VGIILDLPWYSRLSQRTIYGFGMPGTNSDVNMLHQSSVFDPMTSGLMPPVHYTINDHAYNFGYYLADGIYPNWPTFVKAIRHPFEEKNI
jgi:hypothetical protein